MYITTFKEELICDLIDIYIMTYREKQAPSIKEDHHLEEVANSARRRCATYYVKNSSEHGRKFAQTKTFFSRFKSIQYDKFYCIICFCNFDNCLELDFRVVYYV